MKEKPPFSERVGSYLREVNDAAHAKTMKRLEDAPHAERKKAVDRWLDRNDLIGLVDDDPHNDVKPLKRLRNRRIQRDREPER
ncbi:hypothetical protein ABGN05_29610 [Aquibium sp. LZ166]|uniref:Uncharacterized protein n=1 Tax=Aquibium pacificus TaxID=3153579 RepID=A0ABV3SV76_9HYPH